MISHRKLQKLDSSRSSDGVTGKSVFCFAATSNEKEQSHEKIMVRNNVITMMWIHRNYVPTLLHFTYLRPTQVLLVQLNFRDFVNCFKFTEITLHYLLCVYLVHMEASWLVINY